MLILLQKTQADASAVDLFLGFYAKPSELLEQVPTPTMVSTLALLEKASSAMEQTERYEKVKQIVSTTNFVAADPVRGV